MKLIKIFFIISIRIIFILFICDAKSQDNIFFRHFNTGDGLSQNSISNIAQDSAGYIWFATQNGIDIYNGISTRNIKINNKVNYSVEDIFTDGTQKCTYIVSNNIIYKINLNKNNVRIDSIIVKFDRIFKLNKYKNNLLIICGKKIIEIDTNSLIKKQNILNLPKGDTINSVCTINPEEYFLGTNKGIYAMKYTNGHISLKVITQLGSKITNLYYDKELKNLYVITNKKLYQYNPKIKLIKWIILNNINCEITSIIKDKKNNFWLGTYGEGVYKFQIKPEESGTIIKPINLININTTCNHTDCLSGDKITCLLESNDGVIWIGSDSKGISIYADNKQTFSKSKLLTENKKINNIWSILALNKKEVLIGTEGNGLWLLNTESDTSKIINLIKGTNNLTIFSLEVVNDFIMIGSNKGILIINKHKLLKEKAIQFSEINGEISKLYYDSTSNNLWIATISGQKSHLYLMNIINNKIVSFDNSLELTISDIKVINNKNKKQIYIGTSKGLYICDYNKQNKKLIFYKLSKIQTLTIEKGGESDILYIGTINGIKYLNLNERKVHDIKNDNLPKEIIYSIIDYRNILWLSTNHGIYKYNVDRNVVNHYTKDDGLQDNEFNEQAYYALSLPNGTKRLYFGGVNGINYFTPLKNSIYTIKDKSIIEYSFPDDIGTTSTISYDKYTYITLKYNFSFLDIKPIILNYTDPANNQFRYKLDDISEWTYLNSSNTIPLRFTSQGNINTKLTRWYLWTKEHKVTIQLRNSNGIWSTSNTKYVYITVEPNWYVFQSAIFFILLTLTVGYILWKRIKKNFTDTQLIKRDMIINNKINQISRLDSKGEILRQLKKDLLNETFFQFDYLCFSSIDLFNNRVKTEDICDRLKNNIDTSNNINTVNSIYIKDEDALTLFNKEEIDFWKKNSNYSLEDNDILTYISKTKISVIVIKDRCFINNAQVDLQLKDEIYNKLNHNKFARIFIPLIYRSQAQYELSQVETDALFGIIELGFICENESQLNNSKQKLFEMKDFLQTYIDNAAQSLFKAILNEQIPIINDIINKCHDDLFDKINRLNYNSDLLPNEFLKIALKEISKYINVDYSNIALVSFNSKNLNLLEGEIFYGFTTENFKNDDELRNEMVDGEKGITRLSIKENIVFLSNKPESLEFNIPAFKDSKSELSIPLLSYSYSNDPIGVWLLSSKKEKYFNEFFKIILSSVSLNLIEKYLVFKRFLSNLQITNFLINTHVKEIETVVDKSIIMLKSYFSAENITVWTANQEVFFSYKNYSKNILLDSISTDDGIVSSLNVNTYYSILDCANILTNKNHSICDHFSSIVQISVFIEESPYLVYWIFSKRKISLDLPVQDKIFIQQFSSTVSTVIQSSRLISSFINLTSLSGKNDIVTNDTSQNEKLKIISLDAKNMLQADLVTIFPYNNDIIRIKDAVYSGIFPERDKLDMDKPANFANNIIKLGDQFITNEDEYLFVLNYGKSQDYIRKIDYTFWKLNDIKAVAAVRLTVDNIHLGVMFFNYKKDKNFNNATKTIIKTYVNFAVLAMVNINLLNQVLLDLRDKMFKLEDLNKDLNNAEDLYHQRMMEIESEYIKKINDFSLKINEYQSRVGQYEESEAGYKISLKTLENEYTQLMSALNEASVKLEEKQNELEESEKNIASLIPKVTRISFYQIQNGLSHHIKHSLWDIFINLRKLRGAIEFAPEKDKQQIDLNIVEINNKIKGVNALIELFEFDEETVEAFDVFNLSKNIINYFKLFGSDKFIEFTLSISDSTDKYITANKGEITMIIYNLIYNSIDAIISKSENITVATPNQFKGKIIILIESDKSGHKISVEDNGTGITVDDKDIIFNRGFTTKKDSGTGIGLYFVKEIVEKEYFGKVEVTSLIGRMTKFIIYLPNIKYRNTQINRKYS